MAKTTKKSTKKISLAEFRAWLQGVEELQAADWSPNAEQWKLIRRKLNSVIASESVPLSFDSNVTPYVPQRLPPQPPPRSGLNPYTGGALIPPPPVPGGVPADVPIDSRTPTIPSAIPAAARAAKVKGVSSFG